MWDWRDDELVNALDADAWNAVPHPTEPLVAIGPRERLPTRPSASGTSRPADASPPSTVTAAPSTGSHSPTTARDWPRRTVTGRSESGTPHTGQQQLELRGHAGLVANVSFSPDGRWLASYGAEGTVRVWALDLDDSPRSPQRVTRSMTDSARAGTQSVPRPTHAISAHWHRPIITAQDRELGVAGNAGCSSHRAPSPRDLRVLDPTHPHCRQSQS